MTPLQAAAKEICDFLSRHGWKFCVVGGIAATRWGEPRTTEDVDNNRKDAERKMTKGYDDV